MPNKMKNNLRYTVAVLAETDSPLAVNSGDSSLLIDNKIARDANGLPYIPGTSIAGVVRSLYEKEVGFNDAKFLFGFIGRDKIRGEQEQGSRLIFSDAHVTEADGSTVIDGLHELKNTDYLQSLLQIPERDHVNINDRGTVKGSNKYDRQILLTGTRFGFEIELTGNEADRSAWKKLIELMQHPLFRLGSGTRNGSGKIKIIGLAEREYDLTDKEDLTDYLNKKSNLNNTLSANRKNYSLDNSSVLQDYSLRLAPKDFMFFGTSLPDSEVDNKPKAEHKWVWKDGRCELKEYYLLPATSIKGALSHRTAFHFNRLTDTYIGESEPFTTEDFNWNADRETDTWQLPDTSNWQADDERWQAEEDKLMQQSFIDFKEASNEWQRFMNATDTIGKRNSRTLPTGEENPAVAYLFGTAANQKRQQGNIGRVIIEDIYLEKDFCEPHVFNHVKIDRLTGGAYDGALFQEKALYTEQSIDFKIVFYAPADNEKKPDQYDKMKEAFEAALSDIKNELLPLGGAVTKGYGFFKTAKA